MARLLSAPEGAAAAQRAYAAAPGTHVLAIDDDPSLLRLVGEMLRRAGFRVDTACGGEEGLERVHATRPDLVLCDLDMPGMGGFDVLDALRSSVETAALPFVLVTALSDRESVRRGMRLGADDFLCKPVRPLELVEAIGAALDKRRRLRGVAAALEAPPVVPAAQASEAELAGMTGRKLTQTVLFSDIRGFTAISERLPVAEIAELLTRYLSEACAPILAEGGRVMKIMGDGVMAVFGHDDPADVAGHAAAALRAGARIVEAAQRFREWIASRYDLPGLPPFDAGVGIHTGEVMLFHLSIGGAGDLTAVGDTVNVAARLEAKSKELGWPMVASMATLEHAGFAPAVVETCEVTLAGRDAAITVGRLPDAAANERTLHDHAAPPALRPGGARAAEAVPSVTGYKVLAKIGEGGMSSVYLAERADRRNVVLKVLRADCTRDGALWNRFFQECAILSSIDHEHVVRVFDRGFDAAPAYLAMEYLAGGTLRELIQRGLSPRQALSLLSQAASGLAEIHRHGIVHRDIKPANMMLRNESVVVLTDFGVAKRLDGAAGETVQGEILGTPFYLSPEQAQGGEVTAQSDLYSLGVIFYEMLTGRRPFAGETILEILSQHTAAPVPRLPEALAEHQPLVDGMLAKRPADRFASAEALLEAIDELWTRRSLKDFAAQEFAVPDKDMSDAANWR